MIQILSHLKKEFARFRPATPIDVFGLHLAKALGDAASVRSYVQLIAHHGLPAVIAAYRRLPTSTADPSLRAYLAIRQSLLGGLKGVSLQQTHPMIGMAIDRRTIAAAVFENGTLQYTLRRELSADEDRALKSTTEFARRIVERHSECTVALEFRTEQRHSRRDQLTTTVQEIFRQSGNPLWPVNTSDLYASYSFPACPSRKALRDVTDTVWRSLRPRMQKSTILDAVAIGFHAFTRRILASSTLADRKENIGAAA